MSVTVHHGDSREVLKTLADGSIDSVVCDPPYALVSIGRRFGKEGAAPAKAGKTGAYARATAGFMGQKWDTGETAFDPEFWAEVYRVLKPGGHVVAFSGTRTYHRLACAIEDAGFEIRDMVAWMYGSGFPKSHDVSKGIDKAAGVSFTKEAAGGVGFMSEGKGRGGGKTGYNATNFKLVQSGESTDAARQWEGWGTALKPALEPIVLARKPLSGTVAANVLAHDTGALNVDGCRVQGGPSAGGAVSGKSALGQGSGWNAHDNRATEIDRSMRDGRWPANVIHDGSDEVVAAFPAEAGAFAPVRGSEPSDAIANVYGDRARVAALHHGDRGSAARFFYTAKADAEDRLGSKHPTVKPVDLMAYLCRLVTPPGGVILDPFAGTGTTGIAAMREGFDCILIEREDQYVADIHRRIAWAKGDGRLTAQEISRAPTKSVEDLPLFGGVAA